MDGGEAVARDIIWRQFPWAETQNLKPITGSDFREAASNSAGKSPKQFASRQLHANLPQTLRTLQGNGIRPIMPNLRCMRRVASRPMPEPMNRRIIARALLFSVAVPFPRCGLLLRSRSLCENAHGRAARGAHEHEQVSERERGSEPSGPN